jgi:hypothetical protein
MYVGFIFADLPFPPTPNLLHFIESATVLRVVQMKITDALAMVCWEFIIGRKTIKYLKI